MEYTNLEAVKLLLGLSDDSRDEVINVILAASSSRLSALLGGIKPPDELNYIIIEVSVKRFNRIGSEGFTSHEVEGETIAIDSDDFAEYEDDIQEYLNSLATAKRGRVRFI